MNKSNILLFIFLFINITNSQTSHQNLKDIWQPRSQGYLEWWYKSGYLTQGDSLYFFHFTLFHQRGYAEYYQLHLSFHDFVNEKHYFFHDKKSLARTEQHQGDTLYFDENNWITLQEDTVIIYGKALDFSYDITSVFLKKPVWHGKGGLVPMGSSEKGVTEGHCVSVTRMKASANVDLNTYPETLHLTGETWLDRQWGIKFLNPWDWFSIRLFDSTEIALFSFPNSGRKFGSFIDKNGNIQQITSFDYSVKEYKTACKKKKFGLGWDLSVMEQNFEIMPISTDQFNCWEPSDYWEGLCDIRQKDSLVGYGVVEIIGKGSAP